MIGETLPLRPDLERAYVPPGPGRSAVSPRARFRPILFGLMLAGGAVAPTLPEASASADASTVESGTERVASPRLSRDGTRVLVESNEIRDPDLRAAVHRFRLQYPEASARSLEEFTAADSFDRWYPAEYWDALVDSLPADGGRLAWRTSRELLALLLRFEDTGEARYLAPIWRFAMGAMAQRDDHAGLQDFRGRSLPVWGTSRYGDGRRTDFLVHSALVLEPILECLAFLEGRHPAVPGLPLDLPFAPRAERDSVLVACLETLAAYDADFRIGPEPDEGYYVHSDEEGERERRPQPFNRMSSLAWDLVLAGRLAERPDLGERGAQVARFLDRRFYRDELGAYAWSYEADWPELAPPTSTVYWCEDLSHGFTTIQPIPKLARAGVVFDQEDVAGLARTLTRRIHSAEHEVFFTAVCGRPTFSPEYVRALPDWLCLGQGNGELQALLAEFVRAHVERPTPLTVALLVRFSAR